MPKDVAFSFLFTMLDSHQADELEILTCVCAGDKPGTPQYTKMQSMDHAVCMHA